MAVNLTGTWTCEGPSGGIYKILQVGTEVYWRGENAAAGWRNIGHGQIDEPGRQVRVTWADPDGSNAGNHGTLHFEIVDDNLLKKIAGSGGGDFRRNATQVAAVGGTDAARPEAPRPLDVRATLHMSAGQGFTTGADGVSWTSVGETKAVFRVPPGGAAPVLVPEAVNKRPALRFAGTAALAGPVTLGAQSGTIIMVVEQKSLQRNKVPWALDRTYAHAPYSDRSLGTSFSDNSYVNWRPDVRAASGVAYGEWCVLSWVEDGGACKLYKNGALKVTFTGGVAPQWGAQTLTLGNYSSVSAQNSIEGHIAEVLVFSSALTDATRARVERDLLRKYFPPPKVRVEKIIFSHRQVQFTADGPLVETDEKAVIVNDDARVVDISGWILDCGDKDELFRFPEGTLLKPGETATVWTCKRDPARERNEFSMCRTQGVWHDDGDVGLLCDVDGYEIHRVAYGKAAEQRGGETPREGAADEAPSVGLVLRAGEGERFTRRWGLPAVMKIDRINGRSRHLVVGSEDLPPKGSIPVHRHDNCDELLLIEKGTGLAIFGEQKTPVSAGSMIYIPRGAWFSLQNTGDETLGVVYIFSELGYDAYFRETSVPEGQPVVPLTPEEVRRIRARHREFIFFKEG